MDDDSELKEDPSPIEDDAPEAPQPEVEATTAEEQVEPQHNGKKDALAEIRQSLREEEQSKKPGFFARLKARLGGRSRKQEEAAVEAEEAALDDAALDHWQAQRQAVAEAPVSAEAPVESPLTSEPAPETVAEASPTEEATAQETPGWAQEAAPEPPEEKKPVVDRRAMFARLREEEEAGTEKFDKIRQAALEGYSDQPEEPEPEAPVSLRGTMRRSWRDMRPLERTILVGTLFILGAAILIGGGFMVLRPFLPSRPAVTPTPSDLPFPVSVSLPGGWDFTLKKGAVQNGKWEPAGAEWLQGTEVCRWVSLPWTVQLEAVLRTLKAKDEITLSMSNYDKLVYKVQSIQEVSVDQMAVITPKGPCLLLILTEKGADTRWVITAVP